MEPPSFCGEYFEIWECVLFLLQLFSLFLIQILFFNYRKKCSVKNFATDCVKYKCTVFQYIGDLCRYLINSPPSEDENRMSLDFAFGNGMRPDVWETFQRRFHVKNIVEFYGATEGTVGLYNW